MRKPFGYEYLCKLGEAGLWRLCEIYEIEYETTESKDSLARKIDEAQQISRKELIGKGYEGKIGKGEINECQCGCGARISIRATLLKGHYHYQEIHFNKILSGEEELEDLGKAYHPWFWEKLKERFPDEWENFGKVD